MAKKQGYSAEKEMVQQRLRRIEGQVRGLQRMVDGDAYCIDLLTQIAAVQGALDGLALVLLRDHLGNCVADAMRNGDSAESWRKVDEAIAAVERLVRA